MVGAIILTAAAVTSVLISAIAVFVGLHVCVVAAHSGAPLRFAIGRESATATINRELDD